MNLILMYRLERFDRALAFQILWQPPSLTEFIESIRVTPFISSDNVEILSEAIPELTLRDTGVITSRVMRVFLRGRNSQNDKLVCTESFPNNADRDLWFKRIRAALNEYPDYLKEKGLGTIEQISSKEFNAIRRANRVIEVYGK